MFPRTWHIVGYGDVLYDCDRHSNDQRRRELRVLRPARSPAAPSTFMGYVTPPVQSLVASHAGSAQDVRCTSFNME